MRIESLSTNSNTSVVSGAAALLIPANPERNVLRVAADPSGTGTVYLLLGAGTPSATVWHISLAPGGVWNGIFSSTGAQEPALWCGSVQVFGTGARVSVIEA